MTPSERALVLVGPMGAGKTSIGKRVARSLGIPFVDTDALVVREHGTIPEIFAAHGEGFFRAAERDAVTRALAGRGVVSLGGGAVLDPATRAALSAHDVVFLTVQPHVVAGRIGGSHRPLLADGDPVERWQRIFEERRPIYDEVADVTFDTSSGPLSQVVAAVVDWSREREEHRSA
jgi:shikimate kinase